MIRKYDENAAFPHCHLVKVTKSDMSPPSLPPQFLEMVIRFLAEGAASGLNVIAVYVTEILRVTGFDGGWQDGPCLFVCLCD